MQLTSLSVGILVLHIAPGADNLPCGQHSCTLDGARSQKATPQSHCISLQSGINENKTPPQTDSFKKVSQKM